MVVPQESSKGTTEVREEMIRRGPMYLGARLNIQMRPCGIIK